MRKEPSEIIDEFSLEELEAMARTKREREEQERAQQLEQIQKQQQKLQNEIESLTTKLQQKKQELKEMQTQAASFTQKKSARNRTIDRLRDDVLTDMITRTLYESDVPMTTGEIYEQIRQQMEEHAKGGKNPKQAVGSTLASGARYQAVERGLYALTDEARAQVAKAMEE